MRDVTLIPGDGIGPGIAAATVRILEAAGAEIRWHERVAGVAGVEEKGEPLPPDTLASIEEHRIALKGPLTTPSGTGFRVSGSASQTNARSRRLKTAMKANTSRQPKLSLIRPPMSGATIGATEKPIVM